MFDVELIGLPGAGCSSLGALQAEQIWRLTVIDIRSSLSQDAIGQVAQTYLQQMLQTSNGIVFQFVQDADLNQQLAWQDWCRNQARHLPILRALHHQLPNGWEQKWVPAVNDAPPSFAFRSLRFSVPKLNLEHLRFALEMAKQNLGISLWRIKGVIATQEYVNLVALEGTYNRWDIFDGSGQSSGWLEVQGVDLQAELLQELLQASVQQGETATIVLQSNRI